MLKEISVGVFNLICWHNWIDYLFGCASIDMSDGGLQAEAIMKRVRQKSMAPVNKRITPTNPVPPLPSTQNEAVSAPLPPLLKAYFRLGAVACGEPCYDPDFNCADVLVLVDVHNMQASYARHFLDRAANT